MRLAVNITGLIGILLLMGNAVTVQGQMSASGDPANPLLARAVWLTAPVADTTYSEPPRIIPIDPWFGRDKALHVSASFLITLSGQYFLVSKMDLSESRALPISVAGALSVGLMKEIADSQRPRNPHFSWRDMAANVVGVGLGVLLIAL